ncbi:hypothetical protein H7I01_25570, partial [Mycobacterium palustre]|nr:hypothetical protein [Mycobacterium palustre]
MNPTQTSPLARIDLRGAELTGARLRAALPRGGGSLDAYGREGQSCRRCGAVML